MVKDTIKPLNHEIEYNGAITSIHFPPIATKAPINKVIIAILLIPEPPYE